jgi:prephenate dehydrogenase
VKLAVVGYGMMGASCALAAKTRAVADEVWAFDQDHQALQKALSAGEIARVLTSTAEVSAADLTVIALPPLAARGFIQDLVAESVNPSLVTDVVSVKLPICRAASTLNFVGAHPLCGSEKSGASNAVPRLFEDAPCYICPKEGANDSTQAVEQFWQSLGCKTHRIDPSKHDLHMAYLSHLPHILSQLCVALAPFDADILPPSITELARLASSNPKLWSEIYAENAPSLNAVFAQAQAGVAGLLPQLLSGDAAAIESILAPIAARAAELRNK